MQKKFKSPVTDIVNNFGSPWDDSGFSLFRSPFLIPSLLLHGMIFFILLRAATLSVARPDTDAPISVQLIEVRGGGSDDKSIGPGKGPGGPRTMPKLGTPTPPAQRTGKLESGSLESATPSNVAEATPSSKAIALPGPKVLATDSGREAVNIKETSPDSLVRLPTQEAATNLPGGSPVDLQAMQRDAAAVKLDDAGPGIRALKEGAQIPGALKGTGTGTGPHGVPGGSRKGTGLTGGGTGTGSGGESNSGLKGRPASDYNRYLQQLKKRVEAVWKYPDQVTGVQKVAVRFVLDRAGKLTSAEVLDSSDSRLNSSAIEAIKRASPFPPIPEDLKDLANEPLIIRFEVAIRVRG